MLLEMTKIDSTIHEKLEKEANSLSHLKETLNRSSHIAQGMTSILTSFEDRLAKLEQTILPVYNETENLQLRQENIEKTLASLDHVICYYNVSNDVEHVIKDGPTCGLEVYLESIDKIQASIHYFEANNPNSPELQNLTTLFDTAGDALAKEFRALLSRYSKPVPVVTILDLISADEELETEEDKVSVVHLPEKTILELNRIATWLTEHKRDDFKDFIDFYARIRASILLRSLQGLKDHHKSASGSSTSMLPIHGSPALSRARTKDPATKPTKKLPQAINKASKKLEQATGIALGHRRQGSCIDLKDEVMDNDMEFYQTCVTALHKLMQSELKLMHTIIPANHENKVFEQVVHPGLDLIVQEGENIAAKAKKSVSRHDFLGVLTVFPIIKHLISLKPEIDQLLQNCQPIICNKFANVIETLQSMGIKTLEDFIESIKGDVDRQMPKDGTVHELTSNVMMFLEQLLEYVDIVGTLLPENKQTAQPNIPSNTDKRKEAVGYYMLRVLTMLNLALSNKSETYSDGFLKPIFRMNNLHYILKSLQRTGLLEVVQCFSRDVEKHYNDLIREQKRLYSQSWSRVLHYVMEVDKPLPATLTSSKLKDRDRQSIKDKFTGFNKEMEDIYKSQKGYAIPDVELRESLKRENKIFILPKYQSFYDKYSQIHFTKNPSKYIKHTPVEVSNLLERFFDVAA